MSKGNSSGRDWGTIILGSLVILGGIFLYQEFAQLEARGGSIKINWLMLIIYKLLGKWVAAGLCVVTGIFLMRNGFSSSKPNTSETTTTHAKSPAKEIPRHRHLGNTIVSFQKNLFYSLFACLVAIMLSFIIYLASQTLTAMFVILGLLVAVGIYVHAQRTSRLVLHEYGLRIVSLSGEETVFWSEIADRFADCSVVASPNTLIRLILTKRNGKKIVIPNNWKPSREFTAFIWLILPDDSPLLSTGAKLQGDFLD